MPNFEKRRDHHERAAAATRARNDARSEELRSIEVVVADVGGGVDEVLHDELARPPHDVIRVRIAKRRTHERDRNAGARSGPIVQRDRDRIESIELLLDAHELKRRVQIRAALGEMTAQLRSRMPRHPLHDFAPRTTL